MNSLMVLFCTSSNRGAEKDNGSSISSEKRNNGIICNETNIKKRYSYEADNSNLLQIKLFSLSPTDNVYALIEVYTKIECHNFAMAELWTYSIFILNVSIIKVSICKAYGHMQTCIDVISLDCHISQIHATFHSYKILIIGTEVY